MGRLSYDSVALPRDRSREDYTVARLPQNLDRTGGKMKISARNILKGRVKKLVQGTVNTEVTIKLSGGAEIVSIITKDSAGRLKLAKGNEASVIIKASDVMIAVD